MKRLSGFSTLIFVLAILAAACSGGGGGGGGLGGITYDGVTTQAPLTAANANEIFSMMWNGGMSTGSVSLSPAISKSASSGDSKEGGIVSLAKGLRARLTGGVSKFSGGTKKMRSAVPVNETIPGAVSGTLTMTGSIDDTTLTGSMTMTYTNFNDGDGFTIDGVVTVTVDGFDSANGILTDATMSFTSWTMKSRGVDFTLGGSIRMQESVQNRSDTVTINMNGRDNIGNDSFKFENYVETTVYDNLFYPSTGSETYSGRVYAGKYGYVDVSTVSPCVYSNPYGDPGSGGPIILAGAGNTRAAITPLSTTYVKIEVDNNGDSAYEDKNTYAWNNLDGAPSNVSPVANAGPDQNVVTGSLVMLNGSGSSSAIGATLTYNWSFTSMPPGSTATLSNSTSVTPTFRADKSGSYVLNLIVTDGQANSAADTVTITASTTNSAPVANAGPDQNVTTGSLVTLNGSGSMDMNGDLLTYNWSFLSKPAGSNAALLISTLVNPIFTADKSGSYVLSLIVNDGQANSAADIVVITATTTDIPPVANAGPDQVVVTGSLVMLNGSGSSSVIGAALTYNWSFMSKPADSTATLSNSTAINPTFMADKTGSYVVSLIVSNGQTNSAADTVVITATVANITPVANAGPDQNVVIGSVVTLNGSGSSDANGDVLTYNWSFTLKPAGSIAALTNSAAVNPTFTADVEGTYVLSLIVSDGNLTSSADSVMITATSASLVVDQQQPVIDIDCGGADNRGYQPGKTGASCYCGFVGDAYRGEVPGRLRIRRPDRRDTGRDRRHAQWNSAGIANHPGGKPAVFLPHTGSREFPKPLLNNAGFPVSGESICRCPELYR